MEVPSGSRAMRMEVNTNGQSRNEGYPSEACCSAFCYLKTRSYEKTSVVISDCSLHTKERSNMSTKTNPKFLTCKY